MKQFLKYAVAMAALLTSGNVAFAQDQAPATPGYEQPQIIINNAQPATQQPRSIIQDFDVDNPFGDMEESLSVPPRAEPAETQPPVLRSAQRFADPSRSPFVTQRQRVAEIQQYFKELKTLKARFIQSTRDGVVEGDISLSRPGRMRFEYDHSEDFIVADGTFIYYWDSEWEQQTHAFIGSTLADVFLREDLDFQRDLETIGFIETDYNIEVTFVQREDPGLGQLTMVFQKDPMRLNAWRLQDGAGNYTEIALVSPKYGVQFAGSGGSLQLSQPFEAA